MTDPTPQTTPTRDEAVARGRQTARRLTERAIELSAGGRIPNDDAERMRIGGARLRELAGMLDAPAPASGRVDAVAALVGSLKFEAECWSSSTLEDVQDGAKLMAEAAREIERLAPAGLADHHDDLAVDRFAAAMKAKLAKKRAEGRGGWEDKEDCSNAFLSRLLREHIDKGDPVDVGNLAMMIHQRGERIG